MTVVVLQKARGFLVPIDDDSERFVRSIRPGDGIEVQANLRRNLRFHRKAFALLKLCYDSWEPAFEIDERLSQVKSFDKFRKDILCLAGHCDAHYDAEGRVTLVARSMSFAEVGEDTFADLYDRILDVVWTRIMRHCRYRSVQELETTVARITSFS